MAMVRTVVFIVLLSWLPEGPPGCLFESTFAAFKLNFPKNTNLGRRCLALSLRERVSCDGTVAFDSPCRVPHTCNDGSSSNAARRTRDRRGAPHRARDRAGARAGR